MHAKIRKQLDAIKKEKDDMLPDWHASREYELPKLQLNHLVNIRKRIAGGAWEGSEEFDVHDEFRPFSAPRYHTVRAATEPIAMAPSDKDVGHDFLDMTLRDMTGFLHTTKHQLTHARDFLDTSRMPCWTCTKAGPRQKKKFQAQAIW